MSLFNSISGVISKAVNVEVCGYRVERVCTKIGKAYDAVTGSKNGEKIGEMIDSVTPDITIRVP